MTNSILDEIAEKTRLRVARAKEDKGMGNGEWGMGVEPRKHSHLPERSDCEQEPHSLLPTPYSPTFEQALNTPGLSFICEVKKASPSKGIIAEDFPYLHIAQEYEGAGAAAISVLTEPEYFLGSDQYLQEIAATVQIPVLRKDFVIDPYQIYEAKNLGAEAVLLICALLDGETLASYIKIAGEIGLSALVEIHSEAEADQALTAGARIMGINNRDLKTFNVDLGLAARLRKFIPAGIITVAESGIKSPDDVRALKDAGIDAVLIGESLMRAADKKRFLADLKAAYRA